MVNINRAVKAGVTALSHADELIPNSIRNGAKNGAVDGAINGGKNGGKNGHNGAKNGASHGPKTKTRQPKLIPGQAGSDYMERAYRHFDKNNGDMSAFPKHQDKTGEVFQVRYTNNKAKVNYDKRTGLKLAKESDRKASSDLRSSRERVPEDQIRGIFAELGAPDDEATKYIKQIKKQIAKDKKQSSTLGETYGHLKSLENGGIPHPMNARAEPSALNYATQGRSLPDEVLEIMGVPLDWESAIKKYLNPSADPFPSGFFSIEDFDLIDELLQNNVPVEQAMDEIITHRTNVKNTQDWFKRTYN